MRDRMAAFTRLAFSITNPGTPYLDNWHIDVMSEYLEACAAGQIRRLIINIPPRHLKSIACSVAWPAWLLGHDPSRRIMAASYSKSLSLKHSVDCRTVMQHPYYQRLFPGTQLSKDQNEKTKFGTTKQGYRLATSTGSATTGEGGDYLLVDDIHNAMDAQSDVVRKGQIEWFDKAFSTRLDNKKKGVILIIMQRLHECLTPDMNVPTVNGFIKAKDLKVGDMVITSNGAEPVKNTWDREHDGDVIGIKVYGYPHTLWVTPEHPILTERGWINAGDVSSSDRLITPVPRGISDYKKRWPVITEKAIPKQLHTVTGKRGMVSKERLSALIDLGLSSREIAEKLGYKTRQHIDSYISAYGLRKKRCREVSSEILDDKDFWRLVGYWLAEGCLGMGRVTEDRVRLTFSLKEMGYVDDIRETLARYGVPLRVYKEISVYQISFASYQVAQFLKLFGMGCENKFLPEWAVLIPEEYLKQLIIGYFRGDGCLMGKSQARISSVSLPLMAALQRAMLRLDVAAGIVGGKIGKPSIIKSGEKKGCKIVPKFPNYDIRFRLRDAPWLGEELPINLGHPRARKRVIKGSVCLVPVKSIQRKKYKGKVYDIETPCHDFVVNNFVVHNCDLTGHLLDLGGYMHLKIPVEAPRTYIYRCPRETYKFEKGALLHPSRMGKTEVDAERLQLGVYGFSGQYMQNPTPAGGGIFKEADFKLWPADKELPRLVYVVQSYDTAFTVKTEGDPTACTAWGVFNLRRDDETPKYAVLLLDAWDEHISFPDLRSRAQDDYQCAYGINERRVNTILIENKGSGQSLIQELQEAGLPVLKYDPGRPDKVARAHAVAPIVEAGLVYIMESRNKKGRVQGWCEKFFREVTKFPKSQHDDYTDTFTQMLKFLSDEGFLQLVTVDDNYKDAEDETSDPSASYYENPYAV